MPPDVLLAQGIARLAAAASREANKGAPGPEGAPEGGSSLSHKSTRARLMLHMRRLTRRIRPVVAPILQKIASSLRAVLD